MAPTNEREGVDRKFLRGGSEQDALSLLLRFKGLPSPLSCGFGVSMVARGADKLAHSDFLINEHSNPVNVVISAKLMPYLMHMVTRTR